MMFEAFKAAFRPQPKSREIIEIQAVKMEKENYFTPEEENSIKNPEDAAEEVAAALKLTEEHKQVLLQELEKLDIDPVLVLKPRAAWICPPNVNPDDILDNIATWRMPQNRRRDEWKGALRWLFHFASVAEITQCRKEMFQRHP